MVSLYIEIKGESASEQRRMGRGHLNSSRPPSLQSESRQVHEVAKMLGKQSKVEKPEQKNSMKIRMTVSIAMVMLAMTNPYCAKASLGGTADTVQADRARMQAALRMTKKDLYAVHELSAPNHVVVREFVSPTGIVFGVAWQGPVRPDLQQLLGGYFQHFVEVAATQKQQEPRRRRMMMQEPGLVVEGGGHARAFAGRAYVPQLVPAGVQAEEIQ